MPAACEWSYGCKYPGIVHHVDEGHHDCMRDTCSLEPGMLAAEVIYTVHILIWIVNVDVRLNHTYGMLDMFAT